MWRNVYYDGRKECIHLWTWDKNGNRVKETHPYEPFLYVESPNGTDGVSIFNTKLRKISFNNQFERNKFVNDTAIRRLFYNLKCEQEFLISNYKDFTGNINEFPLRNCFFDIETDCKDGFADPNIADKAILLITVYDTLKKEFVTWGTKPYKSKRENHTYHYHKTETDMLIGFLDYWSQDYFDMVMGWNSEGYDIPYILNRLRIVLGEAEMKRFSPVSRLYCREGIGMNQFGKPINKWYIYGISHLDYMEVYQKLSRGVRESYSLDYIAEIELGKNKLAINTVNLAQLAEKDWDNFVDYNVYDVELLVELDAKLKFTKIIRTLSYRGFISFDQALGKVMMITGSAANQALKQGQLISTFKTDGFRSDFEGGYVHEPERGLHKFVVSYDANSLYPNTMITLNLSPETKIGKIIEEDDKSVTLKLVTDKSVTLTREQYSRLLETEQIAVSKAKVLYTQKFKGIIPQMIDGYYKERLEVKKSITKYERQISANKKRIAELLSLQK